MERSQAIAIVFAILFRERSSVPTVVWLATSAFATENRGDCECDFCHDLLLPSLSFNPFSFQRFPYFSKPGFAALSQGAKCSKSRDLIASAICDSNRESQITSDVRQYEPCSEKLIVLTCCIRNWHCNSIGDLNRGSNRKSRDLKVRFELPETAIRGKFLRFGLRDFKALAICDL